MKYNERMREMRKERKLTQNNVASILNVKQRTYADYEMGRIRMPIESIMALAKYYGYSVDYMCGATDERKPFPFSGM